jgi:flagellar basal body rod protein FlgB
MYPDDTQIALYYSQKLDRHFSIPYGPRIDKNPIQAEANVMHLEDGNAVELTDEMTQLISETYDSLSDDNKNKFLEKLVESIESFGKVYEFCQQYN